MTKPIPGLRAMTEQEIDRLAQALGKPIERDYLAYWVSTSISHAVRFANLPSPAQCRDGLLRLARQGRRWLDQIDDCPGKGLLEESNLTALKAAVAQFCERAEGEAARCGQLIKPGTRTPQELTAFPENMVGIAKKAKVLPSTPQRYMETERHPPSFFTFVEQALAIAGDVIKSSPIPERQKGPAVALLQYSSRNALIKIVEIVRGRIGNYRESAHGLVEGKQ